MKDNKLIELPSAEYLHQCFHYKNETGELVWRSRPSNHFSSESIAKSVNSRLAGKIAGSTLVAPTNVYITVRVNRILLFAHRIIFKMFYGNDPKIIDHIDGDGTNNRLDNLRSCTQQENTKNTSLSTRNTSGCVGVTWSHQKKRWWAHIVVNKKQIYLGAFDDFEQAR
ncbi:TPA: HNH endonuclease, partial [Shigella flexneri]|nr:HNH endonuclease [Shigella flexneri]